jgi:hypothetical protein
MENVTTPKREITIDSDWITTILMALIFAFIAFLLGWSIRDLWSDTFDHIVLQRVRGGWLDKLTYFIGPAYCFLFAYSIPAKRLKIAFLLLGANYIARIAVTYLHVGADVQRAAVIAGAIASQIAYAIILLAIARWFGTVVRQVHPDDQGVSDS